MDNFWILAQTDDGGVTSTPVTEEGQSITTVDGDPNQQTTQQQPQGYSSLILLVGLMVVMGFMLFRAPQKQKQERKKLEQSLEKNDKVLTIGGIYGTIVDIKEGEIVLKIDESNNTKIRITSSAVGRNLTKEKA